MRLRPSPGAFSWALGLFALALTVGACGEQPLAFGDANSIIVGVPNEVWERIEPAVDEALERTVFTVADEKRFTVTQVDPREDTWGNLARFKQVLVIGSAQDPWIARALEVAETPPESTPQIVQVHDVWAKSQLVTIALLGEGDAEGQIQRLLDELSGLYDEQYRDFVLRKMYVSGVDTTLTQRLEREAGFTLEVPNVYEVMEGDSVYIFRNDNPDPSELIRQITVTWMSPDPKIEGPDELVAWRTRIAAEYYEDDQVLNLDMAQGGPGVFGGLDAYQIQATWTNPPDAWPAGGPFILRSVICEGQDRVYLLDGWLYAPGKEKYEYMIQLETILNSFRC